MSASLAQAQILMQRGRYEQALELLQRALAENPDHGGAHSMRGACLYKLDRHDEAREALRVAIGLTPDDYYPHFLMGYVQLALDNLIDARRSADEALRLAPELPEPCVLQAKIEISQEHWNQALRWVDRGLSLDAEHVTCANLRGLILTQLGRRQEARQTIEHSLTLDPEDPTAHANQGWQYLHASQPKKALASFREALRLEPGHEWAKAGLVEAIKAKNPLYRLVLAYFLWMARLDGKVRFWLIFGAWLVIRALNAVGRENPELEPLVGPIVAVYIGFVVLSWTAVPMFNLTLRLSPHGWNALTPRDRRASDAFGLLLLVGLILLGFGFWMGNGFLYAWAGLAGLLAVVSATTLMQEERDRQNLMAITGGILTVAGPVAIVGAMFDHRPTVTVAAIVFFLALLVFMFSPTIQLGSRRG